MQIIPDSPVYCYCLIDPRSGLPRYIGISKKVDFRVRDHLSTSKHEKNHKANWLKQLAREGLVPEVRIFNECATLEEAQRWERFWIATGREAYSWPLTNLNSGGEGQFNPSPDVRARMSDAAVSRWQNPEYRARQSEALRKMRNDPDVRARRDEALRPLYDDVEWRARQSENQRAVWEDREYRTRQTEKIRTTWSDPDKRARQSELSRNRWKNPEYRARSNKARLATMSSSEYRVRRSKISKKMWDDPEYRARLSEIRRTFGADPEYRARRSAIAKGLWADPEYRAKMIEGKRLLWDDPEYRASKSEILISARNWLYDHPEQQGKSGKWLAENCHPDGRNISRSTWYNAKRIVAKAEAKQLPLL